MKIGLFFGSFNPIHVGHLIIANHMLEFGSLDEVWFVVSPQNPLKKKKLLAESEVRFHMVQIGIGDHPKIRASDIEFNLPQPSYTINTLAHLDKIRPSDDFILIMGGDNLVVFNQWKDFQQILERYKIFVYERPGNELGPLEFHQNVHVFNAPQLHISASFIRDCIHHGKSVRYLVPEMVYKYLKENPIYGRLDD